MIDTGSQCTLITNYLCKELNLKGRKSKIHFGTIQDIDSSQVQLLIGTDVPDVLISNEYRKGKRDIHMLQKEILVGLFLVYTMVLQTQLKVELLH